MNGLRFYTAGEETLRIGDVTPGTICPSVQLHIVEDNVGIGTLAPPMSACGPNSGFVSIEPIHLVPEGGICRVEPIRRRQRCVSCGNMSWMDEISVCPGCQSQVFENI